jgi:hypothetical protein
VSSSVVSEFSLNAWGIGPGPSQACRPNLPFAMVVAIDQVLGPRAMDSISRPSTRYVEYQSAALSPGADNGRYRIRYR